GLPRQGPPSPASISAAVLSLHSRLGLPRRSLFVSCGGVLFFNGNNLVPCDYCAEVVPTGLDDLYEVYNEKHDVAHCQPEMNEPRPLVSAQQRSQPGELHRLVDRQTRHQRAGAHQNDAGVSNLLRAVVFSRRRMDFAQTKIIERDLNGFAQRMAIREQVTPFA